MRIAALDIGGANVKGYGPRETAVTRPFRLRRQPHDLSSVLSEVLERLGDFDLLAVTMAGELCDCFDTKSDGVLHILASVKAAAVRRCPSTTAPGRKRGWPETFVWRSDGRLAPLSEALADPLPSASANWLALAVLAGRLVPQGRALCVDVGSTTTDLIPIEDGQPVPRGFTDTDRLLCGELVYTGVSRTAVAAVVRELPYRGRSCPVATELFATTRDAYLTLNLAEEVPTDSDTADGQPATRARARDRLARMICADRNTFDDGDAGAAATFILDEQTRRIRKTVDGLSSQRSIPFEKAIISGSGEFLARRALEGTRTQVISVEETRGREVSVAATAYSLWHVAADLAEKGQLPGLCAFQA